MLLDQTRLNRTNKDKLRQGQGSATAEFLVELLPRSFSPAASGRGKVRAVGPVANQKLPQWNQEIYEPLDEW